MNVNQTSMWKFQDLNTGDSYTFPKNPASMTSILPPKQIQAVPDTLQPGRGRVLVKPEQPLDFQFAGSIKTREQFNDLLAWSQRETTVLITDHFGRQFMVVFTDFTADERAFNRKYQWRFNYTMKGLLVRLINPYIFASNNPNPDPNAMPVGNLAGWQQVFAEDFLRTAPLGTFLNTYPNMRDYPYPWQDTSGNGYYNTAATTSAANSIVSVNLHHDVGLGRNLVAALRPVLPTMQYGRFAFRLRADVIPGYKIAPLLWPESGSWPDDGEIDFPEGDLNGGNVSAFAHYARPAGGQDGFPAGVTHTEWHVYETVWEPGKVEFFVDGVSIGSSTKFVPSKAMRQVLQFETQLSGGPPPVGSAGNVQIDWIVAYQPMATVAEPTLATIVVDSIGSIPAGTPGGTVVVVSPPAI